MAKGISLVKSHSVFCFRFSARRVAVFMRTCKLHNCRLCYVRLSPQLKISLLLLTAVDMFHLECSCFDYVTRISCTLLTCLGIITIKRYISNFHFSRRDIFHSSCIRHSNFRVLFYCGRMEYLCICTHLFIIIIIFDWPFRS